MKEKKKGIYISKSKKKIEKKVEKKLKKGICFSF